MRFLPLAVAAIASSSSVLAFSTNNQNKNAASRTAYQPNAESQSPTSVTLTPLQSSTKENVRTTEDGETEQLLDIVKASTVTGDAVVPNLSHEPEPVVVTDVIDEINSSTLASSVANSVDPDISKEAEEAVDDMLDETCEIDLDTMTPVDPECADDELKAETKRGLGRLLTKTLSLVKSSKNGNEDALEELVMGMEGDDEVLEVPEGDLLEAGWEKRGNSSALRRNAEVWKFALRSVFRVLKPRKMTKAGKSTEEEIQLAKTEAATFIRDGLLTLGPSFVKFGQVISTRTDVLPVEYTDVLKTLQDDVPGFNGKRAKDIVSKELGRPCDEIFKNFSEKPLAAASLGQVHTAMYKGKKVAIKVQRAGLKELFDVDLKNLQKLSELLDKFDPKTDGADRNWVSIFQESARLLYQEINYINEADNSERFAKDFKNTSWVRVPDVYRKLTTPRVLTMEFVESFKLTDFERIDSLKLDRGLLAKRTADAFLQQIIETGYFHCDPHPGNLCVDTKGNLVFYDYGMMDELKPTVRSGFRKFCTALFAGGPMISDADLAVNARLLVEGVEDAGVLARGADKLAVEKLARYYMRTFKNKQLGKKSEGIKQTVGTDLQTLTENNVFRFPPTFTFIFRSFASIDGIGKGLDPDYDIGKLAQPFIETFTDAQQKYSSPAAKNIAIFKKATGLNTKDISTAITLPRSVSYIENTIRSMEEGTLKVRVRSLENEKALERMTLTQSRMENILLTSVLLNLAGVAGGPIATGVGLVGAAVFGIKAFGGNASIKKFDKTQAKFVATKFDDDEEEEDTKDSK